MNNGQKYIKKKKPFYNRHYHSKPYPYKKQYTYEREQEQEYTSKPTLIEYEITDLPKPIKIRYSIIIDDNKENIPNNLPHNISMKQCSSSIFNLSSEVLDKAYFIPKKSKLIEDTNKTKASICLSSSCNQSSANYFGYLEDSSSPFCLSKAMNNTCDEYNSNNCYSTQGHLRKMSTRSTSGSFNQCPNDDDVLSNTNKEQSGSSPMLLNQEETKSILSFAPLKEKESHQTINKSSTLNTSSYNKFNLYTKPLNQEDNTEVLSVNVKISDKEVYVFKLKRFDDLFKTVKLFCEINRIEERFIKPLIIKSLETLNQIYQVINSPIDNDDRAYLNSLKCTVLNNEGIKTN